MAHDFRGPPNETSTSESDIPMASNDREPPNSTSKNENDATIASDTRGTPYKKSKIENDMAEPGPGGVFPNRPSSIFDLIPNELLVEIANKLDSWSDFQAFQQVNKRTRNVLDYRNTKFKRIWSFLRPRLVMQFAQELAIIERSTLVSDLKRMANVDPSKSTFREGYGYEIHDKSKITEDENRIWFRNVLGMCERLRTVPVSKLHTLFEGFTPTHLQSRLFLSNVEARTALGLIHYLRDLLLSDNRLDNNPHLHLPLKDLLDSLAVTFGNAQRRGAYYVVVPCDPATDHLRRNCRPVFDGDSVSLSGFIARHTTKMDLLLLAQYYRLVFDVVELEERKLPVDDRSLLRDRMDQVIEEVEEFRRHLRFMESTWRSIEEHGDGAELFEMKLFDCDL